MKRWAGAADVALMMMMISDGKHINNNTFSVKDHHDLKAKMLNWASRFDIFCLLDNNGYSVRDTAFECLVGVGCTRSFSFSEKNNFAAFRTFFESAPSWLFGHLGYNAAGNAYAIEKPATVDFGRGFFFEPETVLRLTSQSLEIVKNTGTGREVWDSIINTVLPPAYPPAALQVVHAFTREAYLQELDILKHHLQRGDCYEINFCQQYTVHDAFVDPVATYQKLSALSPSPFGAFYKLHDKYCFCASPERFLKKDGNRLISQPIKGTRRRDHINIEQDDRNRTDLPLNVKERAENIMIVDLVRNDLSMVCEKGSVKVSELAGVYSFPQVHHLISTVEGLLSKDKHFTEALKACYPMGSMTGAPKKKVMALIEASEISARGLFSGSIGYITPSADFDFNVVIRSIFFDSTEKKIAFYAGSGITFKSNAADEYDECTAKAEALIKILTES
ncbi:MAG: anthranilate synthase component I family protein [Ferruginibacter sp.]